MKITLELDGVTCSVSDVNAVTISEALTLVEQALKGAGFHFTGELDIVEDNLD